MADLAAGIDRRGSLPAPKRFRRREFWGGDLLPFFPVDAFSPGPVFGETVSSGAVEWPDIDFAALFGSAANHGACVGMRPRGASVLQIRFVIMACDD